MTYKLLKDGELVNTIVASEEFIVTYAESMVYTYEEVPEEPTAPTEPDPQQTTEDILNALLGVPE